ncbi:NAD-dependent epimerase/dehydratase family protein [Kineosporia sp. J2-2]|uniref:NAD-dependent epimerase/dehydratase family protein n=1 Tax=Kineosporia corallincola TaxID=2835133 RepID=A0ABS5TSD9_9ACTN|nr:NAD-dependent epimerase/dehydratase family protein [Kineosporia corallincola]MBT0773715.1 NAD-dependent epimerase/dehydratase family protein [Kineosporia corallincola]
MNQRKLQQADDPHLKQFPGPPSWLRGRRILVTGSAGGIGRRLVQALSEAGANVVELDIAAAEPQDMPKPWRTARATIRQDIRSGGIRAVLAQYQPEVVMHLAAQAAVPASVARPVHDADVNIHGSLLVAEAAAEAGAHLIFAATCAIYGRPERLPVSETSRLAPISPYGLSKAAAVEYLDWFAAERGLKATTLILGNVYGAGNPNAVIDRFVADALNGTAIRMHGDGTATRDFVHIDDVTAAFIAAASSPPVGRVNIGSGTETSIRTLRELVADLVPRTSTRLSQIRPGDILRMQLDPTRAAHTLGWSAQTNLITGVAALVGRYRAAATNGLWPSANVGVAHAAQPHVAVGAARPGRR